MTVTTEHTPLSFNREIETMIDEGWYHTNLYDRYGSDIERLWEKKFSVEIKMPTAIFNTGMAAITTVLEYVEIKTNEIILVSDAVYMNTKLFFNRLERRGFKVRYFSPKDKVKRIICKLRPRVIFFETVSNDTSTGEMRVADVEQVIKSVDKYCSESKPVTIVIDNTLPSAILYNPAKRKHETNAEVIVVESGTKHWTRDLIQLGLAYCVKEETIKRIREVRVDLGTYAQRASLEKLPDNLLDNISERMNRHAENTIALQKVVCSYQSLSMKNISIASVIHPNYSSHPDKALADSLNSKGLTSLFYIKITEGNKYDGLIENFYQLGRGRIKIGGSFGHPETWILPLPGFIRVAVGCHLSEDFEEVKKRFKKAFDYLLV